MVKYMDSEFVEFAEVLELVRLEVKYAATILTGCETNVAVQPKPEYNFINIITVTFLRFGVRESFQLEVDLTCNYLKNKFCKTIEYCCKKCIALLVDSSYRNESFLERSEDNAKD